MKLDNRRLTLAPGVLPSLRQNIGNGEEEEEAEVEHRRADGRAALSRVVQLAAEATQRPKPVHAVQDRASPINSKLWAQSGDSDSEVSEDEEPSTPDFIAQAKDAGFSIDQLVKAEKAIDSGNVNPCSSDVRLANSIDSELVRQKLVGAPWKGPLPPPRVSPLRTLGDAINKAAYHHTPSGLPWIILLGEHLFVRVEVQRRFSHGCFK